MPAYNSQYTGLQVDAALAAVYTAMGNNGIVDNDTLTTTLGSYLLSTTAASTYLTKTDAASTYQPIITAGTTGQFYRGDKTWNNTLTNRLYLTSIAQTGNDHTGQLSIISASTLSSGEYFSTIAAMAPNVGSSQHLFLIGTARSAKNSGYYGFHYTGASSDDNYLTMGLYGVDQILNIRANGCVGICTSAPTTTLHVNGSMRCNTANLYSTTPFMFYGFGTGTYTCGCMYFDNRGITFETCRATDSNSGTILPFRVCTRGGQFATIQASAFSTQSSRNIKTNIVDLNCDEALKLLQVRTVLFDYLPTIGDPDQCGVIAEELMEIIPRLVDNRYSSPTVDYSKFVPYLIKLAQIQEEEIKMLQLRITNLEGGALNA